jgi:hypothetical protein
MCPFLPFFGSPLEEGTMDRSSWVSPHGTIVQHPHAHSANPHVHYAQGPHDHSTNPHVHYAQGPHDHY